MELEIEEEAEQELDDEGSGERVMVADKGGVSVSGTGGVGDGEMVM